MSRREVTVNPIDATRRRGRLWAFGYAALADLFGVQEQTVRRWVSRGQLDPRDLQSVVAMARRRVRRSARYSSPCEL